MTHLVMFDIDGTLVDSVGLDGALYAQAVREVLGVTVDETWMSYKNVTDSGVLEEVLAACQLGRPVEEARTAVKRRFVELMRDYLARNPSAIREVAGAREFLITLCSMPAVRVAVATGGWRETAALKLRGIGLRIEDLTIATASDGVERTRIMALAEQRAMLGAVPCRRTYFGDGAWDKRASAELGYDFVGIGRNVEHDVLFDDFANRDAVLACLA
jgi:phosphoglycolate phosphatase-like HAD superfamily hydrolase